MILLEEAEGILSQLHLTDTVQKISRREFDSELVQLIDVELNHCTVAEARLFLTEAEKIEGHESHVFLVV